jgi:hypothetical protein
MAAPLDGAVALLLSFAPPQPAKANIAIVAAIA